MLGDTNVSIHAPREGCDFFRSSSTFFKDCFNSRTPGGVRLGLSPSACEMKMFQFTHPGRGATMKLTSAFTTCTVSIHAPREGCDEGAWSGTNIVCKFQFTHPGRGATLSCRTKANGSRCFNSRTPGGVRRRRMHPLQGNSLSFNSRTPGGVRRGDRAFLPTLLCFNSRTPGGVRRLLRHALY